MAEQLAEYLVWSCGRLSWPGKAQQPYKYELIDNRIYTT